MINLLDFFTSLTAADSRSGQGRTVKATIKTTGYSNIANGLGGSTIDFQKDDVIGILQDTGTAKVTFPNKAGFQKVAYTKVSLNEPFFATNGAFVGYVWIASSNLEFADTSEKPVIPVTADLVALTPVYSDAPSGITLRENATTVSKAVKVVAYGDIVGYTNGIEKKYLTYTFWQIFDQKGKAIGWCAKGKGFSSTAKPQAKALPKYAADGTTEQDYSAIGKEQDPQSGNSSGMNVWKIAAWVFGIGFVLWLGIRALTKSSQKQMGNGN